MIEFVEMINGLTPGRTVGYMFFIIIMFGILAHIIMHIATEIRLALNGGTDNDDDDDDDNDVTHSCGCGGSCEKSHIGN